MGRTNSSSSDGVRIILVGLQGLENVSSGVQGAGPDDAQLGEVQRQQAQLTDQAVLLQQHRQAP